MIKGVIDGRIIFLCLVLCYLCSFPVYANQYVLGEGFSSYREDDDSEAVASDSDGIMLLSDYTDVYDGAISTSVASYFKGIVSRFSPATHYVLFREGDYTYRLVYGEDLSVSGSSFSGSGLLYIQYNSRYGTVVNGIEGDFSLSVSSYTCYTDLDSMYPVLVEGVPQVEGRALLFVLVLWLLYDIIKTFFAAGHMRY